MSTMSKFMNATSYKIMSAEDRMRISDINNLISYEKDNHSIIKQFIEDSRSHSDLKIKLIDAINAEFKSHINDLEDNINMIESGS